MATVVDPRASQPVIAPLPSQNQADAVGQRSSAVDARAILEQYKNARQSRREMELTWEKYLLHIDGEGDAQWADILHGTRVEIPRLISEWRKTENILRPVVDNAVAHHTAMPLKYIAESSPDRRARERALVDSLFANYLAQTQDFNGLFAEAMYLAMPAGFCPVHRYWREDVPHDWYESTSYGEGYEPGRGMIDCWVGNPFTHVFDRAAKRGSVRWSSYERILPADMVRQVFPQTAGLQGSTRLPSTAEWQMVARQWMMAGLGVHGNPVLTHRRGDDDELLALICREIAPGVLGRDDPGRLQIIAVPADGNERRGGDAVLCADQPLPAGDFSWTNFYSHHRGSDIHGKPWVADLDGLQVDLNLALSKRWEYVNKLIEAPIISPAAAISEDMLDVNGYSLIEIEPSLANWHPRVLEWSPAVIPALDNEINEKRSAIYTIGGYQAASRGEAPGSRMAYRAILALQQADSTVHGPVNMRFRRSACDFMRGCWKQMKAYGEVPWLIDKVAGDEYAHLAQSYIDNTKLSDEPPQYKLVNAFGPSPEARAQEILELVQTRGADGLPLLTTAEARKAYPGPQLFEDVGDPTAVQRRRARTIAQAIIDFARAYREQTGLQEMLPTHPWVQQAAQQVFYSIEQTYARKRSDDLNAHVAALSEIVQDETADPIARLAAEMRLDLYYQWMSMGAGQPTQQQAAGGESPTGDSAPGRREVAAEMMGGRDTMPNQ